jgi:ATP-dependent Clp endopeptidase proteolytic subunit ClpP
MVEMKTWFDIQAKASAPEEADVFLYDEIGGWGVNAKSFIDSVRATGAKRINLRINSPGGSVFDGIAIYNFLRGLDVTVQIDGLAASIASIIALAGKEVRIASNGFFMVHNPWGGAIGEAAEMRQTADLLDKIRDSLVGTYASKTGKSEEQIRQWMDSETWFTAAEAKDAGFVDTVTEEIAFAASTRSFRNAPDALKAVSKTAPQAARRAFDKGVRQVEDGKGGDGLEAATVKEARSLKAGEVPTEAKIRKAYRWWARNERFLDAEADTPADVAANLWGGAAGRDWFRALYAQLEEGESASADIHETQTQTMQKLLQSLVSAGLISSTDLAEDAAVAEFDINFANFKKAKEDAEAKIADQAKAQVVASVDAAVTAGRIKPETKDAWVAQILADAKAAELLAAIPAPQMGAAPLGAPVAPTAGAKTSAELRAEFDRITDPKQRTAFWSANKAQLLKR